jgi:hypothetical protein
VSITYADFGGGAAFRNNLFFGGTLDVVYAANTSFQDNFFDRTAITTNATVANSYNGYITGYNRLQPPGATDKILSSLTWQTGALGAYYQPTTSQLINAGSRTADQAGLYHFATTINQVKEAATTVDIGLHYLALNSQSNPVDTDSDYVWDIQEDINGNGLQDAGEFSWTVPDTDNDGDGLTNYQEYLLGTNPVKTDSDGNGVPDRDEDADGDLLTNYAEFNLYSSDPMNAHFFNALLKDAEFMFVAPAGNPNTPVRLSNPDFSEPGYVKFTLTGAEQLPYTYSLYFKPNVNPGTKWMLFAKGLNASDQELPPTVKFRQIAPGGSTGFFEAASDQDSDCDGLPLPPAWLAPTTMFIQSPSKATARS